MELKRQIDVFNKLLSEFISYFNSSLNNIKNRGTNKKYRL